MIVFYCNLKNFKLNRYKLGYTFLSNKDVHVDGYTGIPYILRQAHNCGS